jgi:osmoprotectant transport system substrate-binding protein
MRHTRMFALGAVLLTTALFGVACGGSGGGGNGPCEGPITIGVSSAFAESKIVAEMYGQALANAGCKVSYQLDLGSRKASDQALFSGKIDIKPEYLGSESTALDANAAVSGDADKNATTLKGLEAKHNVNVLDFAPAIDTNVFAVTKDTATKDNLSTVSDLAPVASGYVFGAPPDCATNQFCAIGLKSVYGITFKEIKTTDFGGSVTVNGLKAGSIQVGELFSTSIYDPTFVALTDDKHLEPSDNIVPVIRSDADNSDVDAIINKVSAALTTDKMLALNKQVDIGQQDPAAVATAFLKDNSLLS